MLELHFSDKILAQQIEIVQKPSKKHLYVIIRKGTTISLEVSEDVKELLQVYQHGATIATAAKKASMSAVTAIKVTKKLVRDGVIKSINDESVVDTAEHVKPWLEHMDKKYFQIFLSFPVLAGLSLLLVFGIISIILNPHYLPNSDDFFFTNNIFLVYIGVTVLTLVLVFFHELAHFVVTKAVGGQARITLSNRFLFLVAQTESFYLAAVDPAKRIAVYLAGIIFDLGVISLGIFYYMIRDFVGSVGLLDAIIPVIIAIEFVHVLWQFNIFLETDIYNTVAELLKEDFLRESALKQLFVEHHHQAFFKKWFFLLPDDVWDDDMRFLTNRDKRLVNIYMALILVGFITLIISFVWLVIPRELRYITQGFMAFSDALQRMDPSAMVIPVLFIIVLLFHYTLLLRVVLHHSKIKR